ncbi:amidoligase family protein [Paenibacillus xylanexedens]|uniref:amidoligase family protein n=1 Tax=Paenibacillus xylanexedens TaxID=528191 RepID=UPI000F522A0D|nr:amidoligase family protein [Paenibacillus xylanexedens]RPK19975.1 hypothetical protein EDO6_06492 [Paenibacillus xylanexedens]
MNNELAVRRKVGIEMEGYIENYPEDVELVGVKIKQDGSLDNCDWDYLNEPFGVELCTEPMTDISLLREVWKDMKHNNWTVDDRAGTHIHVDVSDFSVEEKVKLLRFGKGIERIIFLFVDDYRNNNEYCYPLHKEWRKVFRGDNKYADIDWNSITDDEFEGVNEYLYQRFRNPDRYYSDREQVIWNGKYQWMNIFGSRYPTVEYRLYQAVEDVEVLIQQALMSEAIVNLVKNHSLAQLEYIIRELYKQETVDATVEMFFETLGLDFKLEVRGERAQKYLAGKLAAKNAVSEVVEQGA